MYVMCLCVYVCVGACLCLCVYVLRVCVTLRLCAYMCVYAMCLCFICMCKYVCSMSKKFPVAAVYQKSMSNARTDPMPCEAASHPLLRSLIPRIGQNRICTPYVTIHLMKSLQKIPYMSRIYNTVHVPYI